VSPITHFLASWVTASGLPRSTRRERILVALSGVVPDLDGLGAIPDKLTLWLTTEPTDFFHRYHHKLHCVGFAVVVTVAVFAFVGRGVSAGRRLAVALLALAMFHLHLLCDVLGARGPDGNQWPIPYLQPFSDVWAWTWSGQWELNAWPNFAITIALLVVSGLMALRHGRSFVEVFSTRADGAVVAALRSRLG
jgi:hypothetical protein